jgi:arsenite methyltransferase
VEFDVPTLRGEIQAMYGRVATAPDAEFHFHRGPAYAASKLGYDRDELAQLPLAVTSSFAGVGNPHAIAPIDVSAVVLDIGCGAGTDLLLAGRRIGPQGRAIGVDMTAAMRDRAMAGADAAGLTNIEVHDGDAARLPVGDATVDIVISNGVLNLVPDKPAAVREIARVLKPGGRAQIADIVIGEVLPESALRDIDLWTG